MSSSRSSITKRACDGCKIRKIRCGGGHPCQACNNARIKCTYIRVQQPRGPQRLRNTTKYLIEQTQRGIEAQGNEIMHSGVLEASSEYSAPVRSNNPQRSRIPTNILASPLYIYHVRMYPVWPIVDVESVMSTLQEESEGASLETYALATSIAAATIAQLRLGQNSLPDKSITADTFASECLKARRSCDYRSRANLNNVRTSFFLHVYYENQQPGGSESLLYLREAISLAQMMFLHREASYAGLPMDEQQIRRRVLWLLFVTERGVCILHKLPVVLKTNISTPDLDPNDEPQVLPAFLKLLNLFRLFEQSKMFDIMEDDNPKVQSIPDEVKSLDKRFFEMLEGKLQDGSVLLDRISDVQKADLCVTRHWMRMILWKMSAKSPYASSSFPVIVAKELLNIVSQLPRTAIEAHGLGMELKLYEIANSLADAVMDLAMLPRAPTWEGETRPSSILARLHSILSTFRGGGNKELAELLYKKMADAQSRSGPVLSPSLKSTLAPAAKSTLSDSGPSKSPAGHQQQPHATHLRSTQPTSSDDATAVDWSSDGAIQSIGCYADQTQAIDGTNTNLLPGTQDQDHPYGDSDTQLALGLEDILSSSFVGSGLGLTPPAGYPAYPCDPFNLSMQSSSSPLGLPSSSVEMLIGDFISQIPSGQFQDGFMGGEEMGEMGMGCGVNMNLNVNANIPSDGGFFL